MSSPRSLIDTARVLLSKGKADRKRERFMENEKDACRVLIVVTDGKERALASRLFEQLGCHVEVATNSREALLADRADIALVEWGIEGNGLTLFDILEKQGTQSIIGIVPAEINESIREEILAMGASNVLENPIKASVLVPIVRRQILFVALQKEFVALRSEVARLRIEVKRWKWAVGIVVMGAFLAEPGRVNIVVGALKAWFG